MSGSPKWASPTIGPIAEGSSFEERATLSNDNGIEDGTDILTLRLDTDYHGKFFTRGCRGVIESIGIYCIRTGSGELELSYAPHPGIGPVGTITITPGSTWAWKSGAVEEMWNYDSLFIWISDCDSDVSWAYDEVSPPDGHSSDDSGVTWEDVDERPFIRAELTGRTPGDVPVSGTINVISIPNASSLVEEGPVSINEDVETTIAETDGAGTCDLMVVEVTQQASSSRTIVRVYCDGTKAFEFGYTALTNLSIGASTPGISLTKYGVDGDCVMVITKRFEFKRNIKVTAFNDAGNMLMYVWAHPNLIA